MSHSAITERADEYIYWVNRHACKGCDCDLCCVEGIPGGYGNTRGPCPSPGSQGRGRVPWKGVAGICSSPDFSVEQAFLNPYCGPGPGLGAGDKASNGKTGSAFMKLAFRRVMQEEGNPHRVGGTLIGRRGKRRFEGRGEAPELWPSSESTLGLLTA